MKNFIGMCLAGVLCLVPFVASAKAPYKAESGNWIIVGQSETCVMSTVTGELNVNVVFRKNKSMELVVYDPSNKLKGDTVEVYFNEMIHSTYIPLRKDGIVDVVIGRDDVFWFRLKTALSGRVSTVYYSYKFDLDGTQELGIKMDECLKYLEN